MEYRKSHSSNKIHQTGDVGGGPGSEGGGQSSCSGSTRKLSTKEKCRRQKEAERVEKLRLLVSYLRSGSSQPLVSPVTLEADELELAQRYKSHLASRDDLLNSAGDGESYASLPSPSPPSAPTLLSQAKRNATDLSPILMASHHPTPGQLAASLGANFAHGYTIGGGATSFVGPTPAAAAATISTTTVASPPLPPTTTANTACTNNIGGGGSHTTGAASNTSLSTSSCSMSHAHRRSVGVADFLGESVASSNFGAMKSGEQSKLDVNTMSAARSIPHIGQVSWVLRHSISDPGHKFGQHHRALICSTPTGASTNQCSSASGARSSLASALSSGAACNSSNSNNNNTNHHHHQSGGQFSNGPTLASISVGGGTQALLLHQPQPNLAHHRTCSCRATDTANHFHPNSNLNNTNTSHYYNSSSSYNNCNNSSSSSSIIQQNQQPQHQQLKHSPRLFYIDDNDAPMVAPMLGLAAGHESPPDSQRQPLMSTPNSVAAGSLASTTMTQAVSSGNFTSSSICSSSTSSGLQPIQPQATSAINSSTLLNSTTTNATSSTLSSSKSCSAWTNPQNLATWIDNEVNSLVHDLELNENKQKLSDGKHQHHSSGRKFNSVRHNDKATSNGSSKNKEGKRKWLSVTCGNIRRSSSGAQST